MKKAKIVTAGIIQNNAAFMLFLGMCPTLATTKSVVSAFGMGLAVLVTLILTNTIISAVRKFVPHEIRIPILIVIIATIVSVIEMLMKAYMFDLAQTLGLYLSLIIVNCIILGRAEAFAMKNSVLDSFLDAIGTGLGFLFGLLVLAFFREVLGTGFLTITSLMSGDKLFAVQLLPTNWQISLFVQEPGAFIMFGLLAALLNFILIKVDENKKNKATKLVSGGAQ